ncbi:MAG: hypothetical protein K0U52_10330 [Gammaproteobacteria bacterium]|nr:hypothetical protein [Gammaproteobacteria bacterium]
MASNAAFQSLPSKDTLLACLKLASTAEAAEHLAESVRTIFAKARVLDEFQGLVDKFETHAKEKRAGEMMPERHWFGATTVAATLYVTEAENRVAVVEGEYAESDNPDQIQVAIAFDEAEQLNRGYAVNEEAADQTMLDRVDTSFAGWLASVGFLCRGQVIYKATDTGEMDVDAKGRPIQIEPQVFEEKFLSEETGFRQYANARVRGIEIQQPYVSIAEKVEVAEDVAAAVTEEIAAQEEITPKAPEKPAAGEEGPAAGG